MTERNLWSTVKDVAKWGLVVVAALGAEAAAGMFVFTNLMDFLGLNNEEEINEH